MLDSTVTKLQLESEKKTLNAMLRATVVLSDVIAIQEPSINTASIITV